MSNVEKNEFEGYRLKSQIVFSPKGRYGGLNPHYYKREVEEAKKGLKMTFSQSIEQNINYFVVSEEEDIYGVRNDYLLDVYCSAMDDYRASRKYNIKKLEKAQEILKLIELTKEFKHINVFLNTGLVVFDLKGEEE